MKKCIKYGDKKLKNKVIFNPNPSISIAYGVVITFILLPFLLSFAALAFKFNLTASWPSFLGKIIKQSFFAALLGSFLSCLFGYILAHSLFQLSFKGKKILISLLALTMVLPSIIAIEALVAVYGYNGVLNQILTYFHIPKIRFIYNFMGVIIAFTFFNIPFFALIFLERLQSIPQSYWYNSSVFNFSYAQEFWRIEWPQLRNVALHNLFFVFCLCFTSFAPVLILGGGKTQTLTVALYHALSRLDMPLILQIAVMQFVFSGLALSFFFFIQKPYFRLEKGSHIHPFVRKKLKIIYGLIILIFSLYVFTPLIMIIYKGFLQSFWLWLYEPLFYEALTTSLYLAFSSALISLICAFILAKTKLSPLSQAIQYLPLMIPSFVLIAGLFILLEGRVNLFHYRQIFIILSSAIFALPLSLKLIAIPIQQIYDSQYKLAQSLNIKGLAWIKLILWPQLQFVFLRGFAIITAFCFGEFGVIAFLGSQDFKTLPLLLYELMGRRRFGDAEGLACLLLLLYILLFISLKGKTYKKEHNNAYM